MDYKTADRLIELRKKKGFSQEELADKLNISRQAVSKWERAESLPDTENLIALARLYNITLDELINGEKPSTNEHTHIITIPFNRKKTLKIVSYVFLSLGVLFVLIGAGFFLGFAVPETRDLKLAQNESITPVSAEVTHKIKSNITSNSESKYRVAFAWQEGNTRRTGQSNAAYLEADADALVGETVLIRVSGGRAVMVDYQRSVLSVIGFVFIGVFGGLGVLFIGVFVLTHTLGKRQKD